MIDLKLLRDDPDSARASQQARGEDPGAVDALLAADERRRAAVTVADTLRAQSNGASKAIQAAGSDDRPAMIARAQTLKAQVKEAEVAQGLAEEGLREAHYGVPNVIRPGVPAGGEDDFEVLRTVGTAPVLQDPKDHLELGELLAAIDTERGAKVGGSRFYFLTGVGALLPVGLPSQAVTSKPALCNCAA